MSLALTLALALLVAGPAPAPAPVMPAPPNGARMALDAASADVGEVTRPAKLIHDFVVKNTGTGDLYLAVAPHCGCTLATLDKIIKPGTSGKVSLSVDTTRFEGKVTKMASLTSNDPEHASVELTISGTIKVPPGAPPAIAVAAPLTATPIVPAK